MPPSIASFNVKESVNRPQVAQDLLSAWGAELQSLRAKLAQEHVDSKNKVTRVGRPTLGGC